MRKTVREAALATAHLGWAAFMTFGTYLFITMILLAIAGALIVVGLGVLPETVLLIRRMAGAKRRQVAAWTGREIPEAYQPVIGRLRQTVRTVLHDPSTYADLRWMAAHYVYGLMGLLAVPLWPVGLIVDSVMRRPVVLPLIVRLAETEARWSEALLKPSPKARLAERVEELAATRADAIAAHGAELRRIERDLHDGTQARLVALSIRLGLAKRAQDPAVARKLLDDAQDQVDEALTELRHVVRGIHPPILTDRGLDGAVRALAASSGLAVTVSFDGLADGPRAPAAVESAAYYVVAEALTNAAKHSGADRASVRLTRSGSRLRVLVRDEGRGGADVRPAEVEGGSGLLGMRRRVAALDGVFAVTSPLGGPTVIDVELPCVS
jgi:signal transduction histidine kinase